MGNDVFLSEISQQREGVEEKTREVEAQGKARLPKTGGLDLQQLKAPPRRIRPGKKSKRKRALSKGQVLKKQNCWDAGPRSRRKGSNGLTKRGGDADGNGTIMDPGKKKMREGGRMARARGGDLWPG